MYSSFVCHIRAPLGHQLIFRLRLVSCPMGTTPETADDGRVKGNRMDIGQQGDAEVSYRALHVPLPAYSRPTRLKGNVNSAGSTCGLQGFSYLCRSKVQDRSARRRLHVTAKDLWPALTTPIDRYATSSHRRGRPWCSYAMRPSVPSLYRLTLISIAKQGEPKDRRPLPTCR